jgi:hypothetical protein
VNIHGTTPVSQQRSAMPLAILLASFTKKLPGQKEIVGTPKGYLKARPFDVVNKRLNIDCPCCRILIHVHAEDY